MPVRELQAEGYEVTGYFFNPNIHPQGEYELRRAAMEQAATRLNIPMIWGSSSVKPEAWIARLNGVHAPGERCKICYAARLNESASMAQAQGFAAFCTSLLYSRYQNHVDIIAAAEAAAEKHHVSFLCKDFRPHWQAGIDLSKEWALYRQQWCGCELSRQERLTQLEAKAAKKRAREQAETE